MENLLEVTNFNLDLLSRINIILENKILDLEERLRLKDKRIEELEKRIKDLTTDRS